ncbi:hypothetical protein, partial [Hymenobacter guriensis]
MTQEEFVARAVAVHGSCYDYSQVIYIRSGHKIKIICPEHGVFEQTANDHIKGIGCAKCAGTAKLSLNEFIAKARAVHGTKYDYSQAVYTNNKSKIKIICPEHGLFEQVVASHLAGLGCNA